MDISQFAAGIGLFLFGLGRIEASFSQMAGRRFRQLLQKSNRNRVVAVINGALAAGFLQSSSLVILMVISFAGAQMISLSHGIGIVLGANLGTTITGWLVNWLGLTTSISTAAFPMIALGSLGLMLFQRGSRAQQFFDLLCSLGILLLGLNFAKESAGPLLNSLNLAEFEESRRYLFFPLGLILTAMIHSSSGMMAITLTALYSGSIQLESAALIAIGADLGTTVSALVASMKGGAIKRRVGLAHFLINVISAILALALLPMFLLLIQQVLRVQEPTTALVAFHSLFNAATILLLLPFLGYLEALLNLLWQDRKHALDSMISVVGTSVPGAALEALRKDLHSFLAEVGTFNLKVLRFESDRKQQDLPITKKLIQQIFSSEDHYQAYRKIKQHESELLHFFSLLQSESLSPSESYTLNDLVLVLRKGVESAKSLRDIEHNLIDLEKSATPFAEQFDRLIEHHYRPLFKAIFHEISHNGANIPIESLYDDLHEQNEKAFQSLNAAAYKTAKFEHTELDVPSLLNITREIHLSFRAAIEAQFLLHRQITLD